MNPFIRSVSKILTGAGLAFRTFPVTIASALAFAAVTLIRIWLDYPREADYVLVLSSLQWAFAAGSLFGLAAITLVRSRLDTPGSFLLANLAGVSVALATFLALFLPGGQMSGLAQARVSALIGVSLIAFVILASNPPEQSDFSRSFFMTLKAFFIADIYGLVILGGVSGVAFAVEALIYPDMSSKVYQVISTLAGVLAYTIFIGYFPDFRKGQVDEHREVAQKQPRFIEILFGYIMIPIVLALTLVLLLWTGRTILAGTWPNFNQLAGIATGYAASGIWLQIMVAHSPTGLAAFYRKVYPIAALVILGFEAWALIRQLRQFGLKPETYWFALVWILAVAAAILLLVRQNRGHVSIAVVLSVLIVLSVLPGVGYQAMPVAAQVRRLERILIQQGILQNGKLSPASTLPDETIREQVTDSINYLAYADDARLPDWLDPKLNEPATFKSQLGFEQTWPKPDVDLGINDYRATALILEAGPIDIADYDWAINLQNLYGKENGAASIVGRRGTYRLVWTSMPPSGLPTLTVELDGQTIHKQDFQVFADQILQKFPAGQAQPYELPISEMSLVVDTPEIEALLVFSNIEIYDDPNQQTLNYYFNLNAIYMKEKP